MTNIIKKGKLRCDKIKYKDGIGCCIWYPFPVEEGEKEEAGICFDFDYDDIDDMIDLLKVIKETEPEIFVDDDDTNLAPSG